MEELHCFIETVTCCVSSAESEIRPARLLTWCQKQTDGYRNVTITDLTSSWRSGMALCALIHRFKPQLMYVNTRQITSVPANGKSVVVSYHFTELQTYSHMDKPVFVFLFFFCVGRVVKTNPLCNNQLWGIPFLRACEKCLAWERLFNLCLFSAAV